MTLNHVLLHPSLAFMINTIKQKISKFKFQDWFFIAFSLCWVSIIMLDYFNKQVVYGPSFVYFRYYGLFGGLSILGIGFSMYVNRLYFFSRFKRPFINGIVVLLTLIGIVWAITASFNHYWKAPLDGSNYIHMAGKAIYTLGCSFFLLVSSYSSGSKFRTYLIPRKDKTLTFVLLDIALGFVLYTFLMMIFGVFRLLNMPLLIGTLILMILINYREAWWFIKTSLWNPIKWPKGLNFWGGLLIFFILVFLTMNYLYTQAPFPLGFDSRNFYVNISKLVADEGGLIPGFQPYAWGLVMSTGYIAFNSTEITLFISTLGGILALFGIYDFSRRYLNVSSNLSFLAVLLFLISPTVTNHWMIEFKIDLALLFIQIVIINLFMWWAFEKKDPNSLNRALVKDRADINIAIVIGILFGFGLSIKALSIFLVIALFVAMWYYQRDIIGMLSIAALSIGTILLAELDAQSGLRSYHLSPNVTGGILLGLGIIGLGVSIYQSKERFLLSLKPLVISGVFMVLTFSPWVYKNYSYTKSTSLMKLVLGEKPSPPLTAPALIKNYRQQQNKSNK